MENPFLELQLDDTYVKIAQEKFLETKTKSCTGDEIEIPGECYVNKDNRAKTNKIIGDVLIAITTFAAAGIIFAGGVKYIGDMEFATKIRSEANKTITVFEPVGGFYEKQKRYDDGFVDYVNELSDSELNKVYDVAAKEMREEGLLEESKNMNEVVSEMEENYKEVRHAGLRN